MNELQRYELDYIALIELEGSVRSLKLAFLSKIKGPIDVNKIAEIKKEIDAMTKELHSWNKNQENREF